MSKQRIINTRFWIDDYVSNLDPIEKLLFLYFLTNPSTDICGVYEIPLKSVATDTGIEIEMIKKIIRRFTRDKKIYYIDGWVGIKNFIKHQTLNPKVEQGIKNGLSKAPKQIIDRLSEPIDSLSHLNLNSNLNSNSNLNLSSKPIDRLPTPKDKAITFFEMIEVKGVPFEAFIEELIFKTSLTDQTARNELQKFYNYWTESTPSGKKQRWQTEKVFDVQRRLSNWLSKMNTNYKTKGKQVI